MTTTLFISIFAHAGHDHGEAHDAAAAVNVGGVEIGPLVLLGLGVLAVVVVLGLIALVLRRGKRAPTTETETLAINLAALSIAGPPATGPQLEMYNVPVRLAVLVLAPVGRAGQIPPNEQLPSIVDALVPNLMEVLTAHQPEFRRWPPQLSSQGFTQVFFNNVPLPGDGGKGTPYCGAAGRFDTPAGPFLAGLVCVADKPNALGQVTITQPGQWLDVFRVKTT